MMLVLGIILLVIGAALIVIPDLARLAPLGWLLAIIGVVLIIVDLVEVNDADAAVLAMAVGGGGGAGRFAHGSHGAGPTTEQERIVPVSAGLASREPVVVAFIIGATPIVTAFVLQVLDEGGIQIPAWLRSALAGIGAVVTTLAALWARTQVTPTSAPKLDDDTPLVPMIESEHTD